MTTAKQRTVSTLPLGARICLVVAALVLLYAVYQFLVPIDITGNGGIQFGCGSALHPPQNPLQLGNCGSVIDRQRVRSVLALLAAVVIAAGGTYAFGVGRRQETAFDEQDDA